MEDVNHENLEILLMPRTELVKWRSKVIEDSIMIEGYVNAIISTHYLGSVSEAFFWDVLQDEMFNNGLRLNILEKIFASLSSVQNQKNIIEKIRRISKIRNYFAHCNTSYSEKSHSDSLAGVPHPKKQGEYLDFGALYSEFSEKLKFVSEALIEIMDKIGIPFMYDTDTGTLTIFFLRNDSGPQSDDNTDEKSG